MKKLQVKDLRPGMVTAEDIYSIDGQLILGKKIILNDKNIEKLDSFGIYSIKVEDKAVSVDESMNDAPPSYSERVRSTPEFLEFKSNFESHVDMLQAGLNQIVEPNSNIDAANLVSQTLTLMDNVGNSVNLMDMLINMRDYDDSTYAHCVNAAMICNIFAGWLNLSKDDRVLATTCGLFYDIGKIKIPENILKKPGPLTKAEFEAVKRHPLDGYNILDAAGLSEEVKNAALMHHEKCDGSGYPYGFGRDKISFFAKMITIVDIYDAMTSKRVYRDPICPFDVIESFEKEGFDKYDPDMILTFLRNVSNSFIGFRVRLNNGLEGEVVFIHPEQLSRPTIKCGDNKFIDLSVHKNIKITAII
ncbi:MAG: HD-GYP domain-containing protein [Lachnospiraceae bacterium]|nr:HD-GYP domain-containing protein [Lachnospiraceae bacterium]